MKWVSQFADDSGGGGSKMTLANLATVIAPNILYSKSKDPIKDESFYAIETVTIMLQNAEEFATVPEDFIPLLQNLSYEEGDMELNVRHILKKCEMVMKMKRSQSAGGPILPQLPRQHSSPAAVNSDYSQQYPQQSPTSTPTTDQQQQGAYYLSSSPQDTSLIEEARNRHLAPIPIVRSQSSSQLNGTEGGNLLVKELIQ
jgi:hypothetical protein